MIITKESDIFQKLLKDVEDIKIKLNPYTNYYMGCDPYKEEKKPVFKEGDWVIRTIHKDAPRHHEGYIFRIDKVYGSDIREKDGVAHYASSLRMATNEEIKDHLIREAIKKGLTAWSRFKWENEPEVSTMITGHGYEYVRSVDALTVAVGGWDDRRAIYMDGKWATPIFACTEPPKTVSELESLLKDFCEDIYGSDSLCEIYTDVDNFLRKRGYK